MDFKAQRQTGLRYPNGATKLRLYDLFLSCRDFDCTPEEYEEDRAYIALEEKRGAPHCTWYQDVDEKLVVADLDLSDRDSRVVITPKWFEIMPTVAPIVLISYAHEDYDAAQRLANTIDAAGFRPWIDKVDLLGGQPWKVAIKKGIRNSDFVVTLHSQTSVKKRGYVQQEIRVALDALTEFPELDIFLIPVRLQPCEPAHAALLDLQWIDLFPDWDKGVAHLIKSLRSKPCQRTRACTKSAKA
jgi:hypothetical protein